MHEPEARNPHRTPVHVRGARIFASLSDPVLDLELSVCRNVLAVDLCILKPIIYSGIEAFTTSKTR